MGMKLRRLSATTLYTAIMLGLALPTGALSQSNQIEFTSTRNPAARSKEKPKTTELQTVVVTAQKRKEDLQKAPVAVTALSAEQLARLNISNTSDLMQVTPGLQVTTQAAGDSGGSAVFFLRGMGQERSGNGSEPAVGIYIDGFYYPALSGSIFDIVDLSQVQVLRGPQGTLFGRDTIGGAILYTTKQPELGQFSGELKATLGSDSRQDFTGAVNIPVGDNAALRLTAGHLKQDGFVHVQSGGPDAGATGSTLVRAQLLIKPTDTLTVNLSTEYSKSSLNGFAYNMPGPLTPVPPAPGGSPTLPFVWNAFVAPHIPGAPFYTDAFKSTCYYCQFGTLYPEFSDTTYRNANATVEWDFAEGWSLKSLSGWQTVNNTQSVDTDGTPVPIFSGFIAKDQTKAWSQELQLSGNLFDDRLKFVGGLYYYRQENPGIAAVRPGVVLGVPQPTTFLSDLNLNSRAVYLDGTYKLTDQLSLLGGYRYSEDSKSEYSYLVPSGASLNYANKKFPSNTYRLGVQYQWNADVMTYATASTGFRAGGFNPTSSIGDPALVSFNPEKATTFEAGARMQFQDRHITINPTVFHTLWNDIQVQSVVPNAATGGVLIELQNAAKAKSDGAELEWSAVLPNNILLFGNIAYLDIKYTSLGSASGITLKSHFQDAPKLTYAAGITYDLDLSSGADITWTVNYSHHGEQYSTPTDVDQLLLKAYGLLNARVQYNSPDGKFSVALFGTNLTSQKYAVGGVNYYANVGAATYNLGQPREYGVTAQYNF